MSTSEEERLRRCGSCGIARPLDMFYLGREERSRAAGRIRLRPCRICIRDSNAARRKPRQAIINQIKATYGCTDCGIKSPDHPEIFDFDHLPGTEKAGSIAKFSVAGSIEDLMEEIAKCEVVCANCHRIRTCGRESTWPFGRKR